MALSLQNIQKSGRLLMVNVHHSQQSSRRGKSLCNGPTNAGSASRHHDNLAGKSESIMV